MKKLVFIVGLLLVIGCSPQKRLTNILKNHPELVQNDTIEVVDTIKIPEYTHDTTSFFHNDTLIIENDRYKLEIIKGDNDTIRTGLLIKSYSIYEKDKQITKKYKVKEDLKSKWLYLIIFIESILLLVKFKR